MATTKSVPMAEMVLQWLQKHIERNHLGPGDPLPKEIEIASATGASRISVREALTAMKVLGIIRSRRRGGIRIIRGPALLGLRDYFTDRYDDRRRFEDALEFRSLLEGALAPLVAARITAKDLAAVGSVIDEVRKGGDDVDLIEAEWRFHGILSCAAGNRLAQLISEVYAPVFRGFDDFVPTTDTEDRKAWADEHERLIEPLARGDGATFIRRMREHVSLYLTGSHARANPRPKTAPATRGGRKGKTTS